MKRPPNLNRKTIRIFLESMKPFRAVLLLVIGLSTVSNILAIAQPVFYKKFFDAISGQTPNDDLVIKLIIFLSVIVGLTFLRWGLTTIAGFTWSRFVPAYTRDLATLAFATLHRHAYSLFTKNLSGSLSRKASRFIESGDRILDSLLWNGLSLVVSIIGVIIVVAFYSPLLSGIIILWVVIYSLFAYYYNRYKSRFDSAEAAADSESGGRMVDTIVNAANVKLAANLSYEKDEFLKYTKKQEVAGRKSRFLSEFLESMQWFLMNVLEGVMLFIIFFAWRQGRATVGDFVLIQAYMGTIFERVWGLGRTIRQVTEHFSYAREMTELIDATEEVRDKPKAQELQVTNGKIDFVDVTFNYNETREILRHLNLSIAPGEKVGIVGGSGAGKSTLVAVMLRLYDVTGGKILIDDQRIADVTQESLRRSISLIPQDVVLFHRTVMENIRYGRIEATDQEVIDAAKLARCDEFIQQLPQQYNTMVGERGVKLSGGERQRIAIARAILKNAPILILDEATSSLDSQSEKYIQESLALLMKNKTTLVIAHRLSTLTNMDRIVVIEQGRVAESGTHHELIQRGGKYKQLWDVQVGGFLTDTDEVDGSH